MALMRGVLLAIAVMVLAAPLELPGCGGGPSTPAFVSASEPEDFSDGFLSGELGVLQPQYRWKYLVIAYRYLTGVGLNQQEQDAILHLPLGNDGPKVWTVARARVPIPGPRRVEAFRSIQGAGYYDSIQNCGPDAFQTAALTMADRAQKFGAESAQFREWVQVQDMVFANCSGGESIPKPSTDPLLRADREYQIAAAKFYAQHFEDAQADFERIALDKESPWRAGGRYLAARCTIRREKYAEAEARLTEIMDDRSAGEWRERARLLRNFVLLKTHREERLHELSLALVSPHAEKTIAQDLVDYSYAHYGELGRSGDLGKWIETFQNGQGPHALDKWRETRSLPWLVAALHYARPGDDAVSELLAAAREVPARSPGYVTVSYHMVRLLPADEARAKADALLKTTKTISGRNLFLKERLRLARNLDEFYRFAIRRAAGYADYAGTYVTEVKGAYMDSDSGDVLNRGVPLSVLRQAAKNPLFPPNVQKELARVVMARELILSANPPFDGVLTLLRSPGISPWLRDGFGRSPGYGFDQKENVPTQMSYLRDNWWAALKNAPPALEFPLISEEQRRQAAREWEKLRVAPAAATWLGMHTVAFATAHPDDPRVPEALHLVVQVSHYSAGTDERSGEYSRRAFNLLHRRYPASEWTKKTPYWYE